MDTITDRDLGGSAGRVTHALDEDMAARNKAQMGAAGLVWSLNLLLAAGADKLDVIDVANAAIDTMANLNGKLRDALDDIGLLRDEQLDLSPLESLRDRLVAETSLRVKMMRGAR